MRYTSMRGSKERKRDMGVYKTEDGRLVGAATRELASNVCGCDCRPVTADDIKDETKKQAKPTKKQAKPTKKKAKAKR